MKRRHVAIFTNLGNGHVYPTLGVCSELISRDHRATWVTDAYYSGQVREAGAEPVIFTPAKIETAELTKEAYSMSVYDPRRWFIEATYGYPYLMKDAKETLAQIEGLYTTQTPDVILYDRYALAGRILAERLRVPSIQLCPVVPPYKNYIVRLNGVCMAPEPMLEFSSNLDSFMAAYGIDHYDGLFHVEDLNICFMPKEFHHHAEWFDNRFRFVGSCLNRPFRKMWKRTGIGEAIVLVSGLSDGYEIEYFKLVVAALAHLDCHVILSIGRRISAESLGELPTNFEVNLGADHLEILPYASLTICQGGIGTILESVHHCVPLICIPVDVEQEDNSFRVEELGLGRRLRKEELTVDSLRNAVLWSLGNAELSRTVRRWQRVFAASGGAQKAVDSIEEFLCSH